MTAKKQRAYKLGKVAEVMTATALRLKGYRIIARGRKSGRGTGAGEVDIIARRGEILAFVEVKARRDASLTEVLTRQQQQRITKAAAFYIAKNPQFAHDCVRFDVALVRPWCWPRIIENAWQSDSLL